VREVMYSMVRLCTVSNYLERRQTMKKVVKGMVILGLFSLFILGLAIQDTKAAEFPLKGWPKGVVCASGSMGSLYYVQSVAGSKLSSDYLKVKATVVATGAGSGQQIDLFRKNEADLGTMADISVYEASLGIGSYKGKQIKNMRAVVGSTYYMSSMELTQPGRM